MLILFYKLVDSFALSSTCNIVDFLKTYRSGASNLEIYGFNLCPHYCKIKYILVHRDEAAGFDLSVLGREETILTGPALQSLANEDFRNELTVHFILKKIDFLNIQIHQLL